MEENKKPEIKKAFVNDIKLRDHFAGLAMQSVLEKEGFSASMTITEKGPVYEDNIEYITILSYRVADAMLKQRELKTE